MNCQPDGEAGGFLNNQQQAAAGGGGETRQGRQPTRARVGGG